MGFSGAALITAFAAPWFIVYYIFMYNELDPKHCWITEGQLTVHAEAQGNSNEEDLALVFHTWVMYSWFTVLVAVAAPCLGALCSFGLPYTVPCVGITAFAFILSAFARLALFWYAVVIRFRESGFIASGKRIAECKADADEATLPNCDPEGVFQEKTGKLLLVCIIISIFTVICRLG